MFQLYETSNIRLHNSEIKKKWKLYSDSSKNLWWKSWSFYC